MPGRDETLHQEASLHPFEERSPEERVAKGEVWAELVTALGLAPGCDRIFERVFSWACLCSEQLCSALLGDYCDITRARRRPVF